MSNFPILSAIAERFFPEKYKENLMGKPKGLKGIAALMADITNDQRWAFAHCLGSGEYAKVFLPVSDPVGYAFLKAFSSLEGARLDGTGGNLFSGRSVVTVSDSHSGSYEYMSAVARRVEADEPVCEIRVIGTLPFIEAHADELRSRFLTVLDELNRGDVDIEALLKDGYAGQSASTVLPRQKGPELVLSRK